MAEPNVVIVSDLRCLSLPRILDNYDPANELAPTSNDLITSWERLRLMTMDEIKSEIQMMMWVFYELSVRREDFVLLLSATRNEAFANHLIKADYTRYYGNYPAALGHSLWNHGWSCTCSNWSLLEKLCPTYFMQLETFCPTVAPSLKEKGNLASWPCVCVWNFSKEVKLVPFTIQSSESLEVHVCSRGHRPIVDTCANGAIPQWGKHNDQLCVPASHRCFETVDHVLLRFQLPLFD